MERQLRILAGSAGIALVMYVVATSGEAFAIRAAGASAGELVWISDILLAAALGLVSYAWLHLRETRATLARIERDHIVVDTELRIASDIQQRLLPPPPAGHAVHCAARLQPAGPIGGDMYDFVAHDGTSLLVLVGDLSGKGIPAALMHGSTRVLFRALARDTRDPATLMSRLSDALYQESAGSPYLTCWLGLIESRTGTLTYVNAGHPAGLLIDGCHSRLMKAGGPPAGMFAAARFESEVLALRSGVLGVVVTDGVTEAIEQDDEESSVVIARALREPAARPTLEAACDAVMQLAADGRGPVGVDGWHDDRTVVAFMLARP